MGIFCFDFLGFDFFGISFMLFSWDFFAPFGFLFSGPFFGGFGDFSCLGGFLIWVSCCFSNF